MKNNNYIGDAERKVCVTWLQELMAALSEEPEVFDHWLHNRVPELRSEMKTAIEFDRRNGPVQNREADGPYGYMDEKRGRW